MLRRDFIAGLGVVAAWPLMAGAQQAERVRRVAVLMNYLVNDPEAQTRVAAFRARMREAGWIEGQNIQIDFHWGAGGADHMQSAVATLIGLSPHVIVSSGTPATKAAQQTTSSIPKCSRSSRRRMIKQCGAGSRLPGAVTYVTRPRLPIVLSGVAPTLWGFLFKLSPAGKCSPGSFFNCTPVPPVLPRRTQSRPRRYRRK